MSRKERDGQVQQFDALYVVSDLHIGGPADGQIFRQSELLASLIRTLGSVSENSPTRSGADVWNSVAISDQGRYAALPGTDLRVGLVLNGDVVDFLAEPSPVYLDIDNGKNKLEGIVNREPFKDVFVALREYLGQENRFLVLVLGNHDVELALPGPQQWLREWLAGGDDAASGRLILATDGSGFRCQVGTSDVLCIHGEIADDWNRIDHQGLRAIAHGWKAGRSSYDWTPNGGTRLVIDVMNEVKETYAFVDLLKPEIEAVLPILNALDAKTAGRAFRAARAYAFKVEHGMIRSRFLSDDGQRIEAGPEDLFACAAMQILGADQDDGLSALEQAEKDVRDGADPVELARADSLEDEMLSWWRVAASTPGSLYNRLRGKSNVERVRLSLQFILAKDETFTLESEDDAFVWSKTNVDPDIEFVVAGHTHLERAIQRSSGGYFNSGTWASLIRLSEQQLSEEAFGPVFETLRKCRKISELEEAELTHTVPTVVSIVAPSSRAPAVGQLHLAVNDAEHEGQVRLTRRNDTRSEARG